MSDGLPIFHGAVQVGAILRSAEGPRLVYDELWRSDRETFPISLSLPRSAAEHPPEVVVPWLMNLLPEGEPLRAMTRALGVAQDDILGLIAETGGDLAGALTIGVERGADAPGFVPIPRERDLERIIEELPSRPFLVGDEGVSMSLAGAQDKLPLALHQGRLAVPVGGASSTHILKPDNPRLPGSVQNEALCMLLAARCKLPTAQVSTGRAGRRSYLLVRRYDRVERNGDIARLHQEDFCQALGRPPAAKYQHSQAGPPGPSLGDMFGLVRAHMTAREITRLLDGVIFNVLVGNVDSHAKNYSVLLGGARPELAPFYDLMSGLAWPSITQNHAQDIGGQRRGRHVWGRHWRRMAEACGLAGPPTVRRVQALAKTVLTHLPGAAAEVRGFDAGDHPMLARFAEEIAARAKLVAEHAAQDGPAEAEPPAQADGGRRYDG